MNGCAIETEPLISLSEATRLIPPRNGRRVSTVTVWRWCAGGLYGVRLEYVQYGRRVFTTAGALARFSVALAEARHQARNDEAAAGSGCALRKGGRERAAGTSKAREDRARRAEAALDRAGVR